MSASQEAEVLEVVNAAVAELSRIGVDDTMISEIFFAYAMRLGFLMKGENVFADARNIIDAMERQNRDNTAQ